MDNNDNKIISLSTPLIHAGVIFQTHNHVENMLSTIGVELTRSIVDCILGKKGLFVYIPLTLAEEISYTTLNDMYRVAIENNMDVIWQENVYYLINNFVSGDII